jgi:NAD(P)-dependent dehydrogenase (short-subunit alcohol dehydrogenase family)
MAQNKVNNVLVIGGSSGVGLATAKISLSNLPGANVIVSSSNKDKLEKAVEEIKASAPSNHGIVDYVVGDIGKLDSQHEDIEEIFKAATEKLGGKIDHVVC